MPSPRTLKLLNEEVRNSVLIDQWRDWILYAIYLLHLVDVTSYQLKLGNVAFNFFSCHIKDVVLLKKKLENGYWRSRRKGAVFFRWNKIVKYSPVIYIVSKQIINNYLFRLHFG